MIRVFFLISILFSSNLLACAYVGEPPSVDDLISEFGAHYEDADEIIKVKVVSTSESSNDFEILTIYKSTRDLPQIFTYNDFSDCNMTFKVVAEEYIVFGIDFGDTILVFGASAMHSDNPDYTKLEKMLDGYGN